MKTALEKRKPILIIGYGDQEKSDEGAGYWVAEIIKKKELKNIEVLSVPHLTPSLASVIVQAKTVIFISCYFLLDHEKPELIIKHLLPNFLTHSLEVGLPESPSALLSFTESIYHRIPNAFWILIPAEYHQKGQGLSRLTQKGIKDAIAYLNEEKRLASQSASELFLS